MFTTKLNIQNVHKVPGTSLKPAPNSCYDCMTLHKRYWHVFNIFGEGKCFYSCYYYLLWGMFVWALYVCLGTSRTPVIREEACWSVYGKFGYSPAPKFRWSKILNSAMRNYQSYVQSTEGITCALRTVRFLETTHRRKRKSLWFDNGLMRSIQPYSPACYTVF